MTLRERLEQAKADRRQAAGLPAEEPQISPMDLPIGKGGGPPDGHDEDSAVDLTAIDLTSYAPVVDLRPALAERSGEPSFTGALAVGEGERCPLCSSEGRLDMEDVVGGVDHYSCTNCGLLYQVAR